MQAPAIVLYIDDWLDARLTRHIPFSRPAGLGGRQRRAATAGGRFDLPMDIAVILLVGTLD